MNTIYGGLAVLVWCVRLTEWAGVWRPCKTGEASSWANLASACLQRCEHLQMCPCRICGRGKAQVHGADGRRVPGDLLLAAAGLRCGRQGAGGESHIGLCMGRMRAGSASGTCYSRHYQAEAAWLGLSSRGGCTGSFTASDQAALCVMRLAPCHSWCMHCKFSPCPTTPTTCAPGARRPARVMQCHA